MSGSIDDYPGIPPAYPQFPQTVAEKSFTNGLVKELERSGGDQKDHSRTENPGPMLPKNDCQYILLNPEQKGLRCACVGFTLNRLTPGVTCNCGHQLCYHSPENDVSRPEQAGQQEVEALREKVAMLEEDLDKARRSGRGRSHQTCKLLLEL